MYAGDEMLAIIIHQAKGGEASGAASLTFRHNEIMGDAVSALSGAFHKPP